MIASQAFSRVWTCSRNAQFSNLQVASAAHSSGSSAFICGGWAVLSLEFGYASLQGGKVCFALVMAVLNMSKGTMALFHQVRMQVVLCFAGEDFEGCLECISEECWVRL